MLSNILEKLSAWLSALGEILGTKISIQQISRETYLLIKSKIILNVCWGNENQNRVHY